MKEQLLNKIDNIVTKGELSNFAFWFGLMSLIIVFYCISGSYSSFLQKEIFEQPESVVNTMRGRVNFEKNEVILGGIKEYMTEIKRCRRLLFIACGTSYNSAIAVRYL